MSETTDTVDTNAGEPTRCGFIAVIGAPNAGKSTLVNALVGAKVSIVSPKAQTTRTIVRGIAVYGPAQVIYVDTPGIFAAKQRLERAMVAAAWMGAAEAEGIMFVVDAAKALDGDSERVLAQLKDSGRKAMLVLNKVDIADKAKMLDLTKRLNDTGLFSEVFMVSALTGDGLERIKAHVAGLVPPGPWLFPEDDISDMPGRLLAAEITREQLFMQLSQELPYSCAVETERWEDRKDGSAKVDQTIYVSREGHKSIVLGEGGKRIKSIGAKARAELEKLLDRKVHLFLHVKVKENWREDRGLFSAWGLDFNA
ncbi:MAG: GTPase Era [Rhodospirillaceae bacterium]|nr:GTPase Era [Rhodospirillaceae bacterium]